jgi:succinate-acetate transporter protein
MSAADLSTTGAITREDPVEHEAEAEAPVSGDPAALGLPCFVVGSLSLGLALVGVVPATALGAAVPIILTATAVGLFLATIWAALLHQTAVASVFGIFGGFWLSFAALIIGLNHNWFGVLLPSAIQDATLLFLLAWMIVMAMLTFATLRLPAAFTAVFFLVTVALVLVYIGTDQLNTDILKAAGAVVLLFAAIGMYLYFSTVSMATGGPAYPLGRPLLRSRG